MGCHSCGGGTVAATRWTVDLSGTDVKFADGSVRKVYMTVSDANAAVQKLGLSGIVKPRPATAGE